MAKRAKRVKQANVNDLPAVPIGYQLQIVPMLEGYFSLKERGTDIRTEFIAGVTTFLTMLYIVFVNPQILGKAGMDPGAVFVATCIAAAVSTFVMAFYARYPIALAPGMGINAFFAFTVVLTYKYTWQQALAAVFCSGVLFFLISIFRIRQYVIDSIPHNLKLATSAGVGLFLGIIALEEAHVVVAQPATLVTLGDLKNPVAILMLLGFVLIAGLNYRRSRAALRRMCDGARPRRNRLG
jgi:AGZA family xanthine/uracil permease-like MFS transporter